MKLLDGAEPAPATSLLGGLGITGTFFLFAGVGALALGFIATQVPETRGRSLEALDADIESGAHFRR